MVWVNNGWLKYCTKETGLRKNISENFSTFQWSHPHKYNINAELHTWQ